MVGTQSKLDFYPRSPYGERQNGYAHHLTYHQISIHALLTESDLFRLYWLWVYSISIHALLTESDVGKGSEK